MASKRKLLGQALHPGQILLCSPQAQSCHFYRLTLCLISDCAEACKLLLRVCLLFRRRHCLLPCLCQPCLHLVSQLSLSSCMTRRIFCAGLSPRQLGDNACQLKVVHAAQRQQVALLDGRFKANDDDKSNCL
jgi:hypothetical protein